MAKGRNQRNYNPKNPRKNENFQLNEESDRSSNESISTLKPVGLSNLGNTCFFNAVMQSLIQTPSLVEALEDENVQRTLKLPPETGIAPLDYTLPEHYPLTSALFRFLNSCRNNSQNLNRRVVSPQTLFNEICKKCSRFRGYQQQDSQELLRTMLDEIKSEEIKRKQRGVLRRLKLERSKPSDVPNAQKKIVKLYGKAIISEPVSIDTVFQGSLISSVMCDDCGTITQIQEDFLDLSLPILEGKGNNPSHHATTNKSKKKNENLEKDKTNENSPKQDETHENTPSKTQRKTAKKQKKRQARLERKKRMNKNEKEVNDQEKHENDKENCEKQDGTNEDAEVTLQINKTEIKTTENQDMPEAVTSPKVDENFNYYSVLNDEACQPETELVNGFKNLRIADDPVEHQQEPHQIEDNAQPELSDNNNCYLTISTQKDSASEKQVSVQNQKEKILGIKQINCDVDDKLQDNILASGDQSNQLNSDINTTIEDNELKSSLLKESSEITTFSNLPETDIMSTSNKMSVINEVIEEILQKVELTVDNIFTENVGKVDFSIGDTTSMVCGGNKNFEKGNPETDSLTGMDILSNNESRKSSSDDEFSETDTNMNSSTFFKTPAKEMKSFSSMCNKLPETFEPHYEPRTQECSVESCLHKFTMAEILTGGNMFGCETCTKRQIVEDDKEKKTVYCTATKMLLIDRLPPVLTIHLKRFQQAGFSLRKVNKKVSLSPTLNMGPFCSSKCSKNGEKLLYYLYGIVEHSGSLSRGHYTAYVNTYSGSPTVSEEGKLVEPENSSWYYISDTSVSKVTQERALNSNAYLLFYQKAL